MCDYILYTIGTWVCGCLEVLDAYVFQGLRLVLGDKDQVTGSEFGFGLVYFFFISAFGCASGIFKKINHSFIFYRDNGRK